MTNVIQLTRPSRINPQEARLGALLSCFAEHRRYGDDVFWLKENAEILNILECTGIAPGEAALETYAPFYESVEKRLRFFPQYYRFFLSMALDLEDLGSAGGAKERSSFNGRATRILLAPNCPIFNGWKPPDDGAARECAQGDRCGARRSRPALHGAVRDLYAAQQEGRV